MLSSLACLETHCWDEKNSSGSAGTDTHRVGREHLEMELKKQNQCPTSAWGMDIGKYCRRLSRLTHIPQLQNAIESYHCRPGAIEIKKRPQHGNDFALYGLVSCAIPVVSSMLESAG